MSVAALVDKLVAGGMSAGEAAEMVMAALATAPRPRTARQNRNQRYYENKRLNKTLSDVSDASPSPSSPPSMVSLNNPSLTTPLSPPSLSRSVAKATRPEHAKFSEFWEAYPRRQGPNPRWPASQKFSVAVGAGADPDRIVASARAYAAEIRSQGRERTEFVKQAMTWLNQRLFEDYGSAQPVENAGGWRPGLRTTEEILADLAREKGNGDELEGKGRGLGGNPPLGEASLRPRDGEQELVRRETRKPGMQSLGGIFRKAGMVANVVSEARAVRDAGRCEMDGPVPMARVVND